MHRLSLAQVLILPFNANLSHALSLHDLRYKVDLQTGEGVFEKGDEVCSKVHDLCSFYPY